MAGFVIICYFSPFLLASSFIRFSRSCYSLVEILVARSLANKSYRKQRILENMSTFWVRGQKFSLFRWTFFTDSMSPLVRAPRPLTLLRAYKIPFTRIKRLRSIVGENMCKIGEITVYIVYCLLLFALIGGQLFVTTDFFCVKKNTTNLTSNDFIYPVRRYDWFHIFTDYWLCTLFKYCTHDLDIP